MRSTASQMVKKTYSVKCSTTQKLIQHQIRLKKEIKFNPRLAKNTQCSNSRFKPLKLHQTYNPTPTHRNWLRRAGNMEIEAFPTYLYFKIN